MKFTKIEAAYAASQLDKMIRDVVYYNAKIILDKIDRLYTDDEFEYSPGSVEEYSDLCGEIKEQATPPKFTYYITVESITEFDPPLLLDDIRDAIADQMATMRNFTKVHIERASIGLVNQLDRGKPIVMRIEIYI
jgi:hypothetical protein